MKNAINEQDLSFNSRRLSRVLTNVYDRALRISGIRSTQFNILCFLSDFEVCIESLNDMAFSLSMDRSTLSRNLKTLMNGEYVGTAIKRSGRNTPGFFLTEKGKSTLDKASPLWAEIQDKISAQIGEERSLTYIQNFNSLINVVSGLCSSGGEEQ